MEFKEKCDVCKSWVNRYVTYHGHIFCEQCFQETQGKIKLSSYQQVNIDDLLVKGSEKIE